LMVPALGGPERKVGEVSSPWHLSDIPGPYLSWTPDSNSLLVSDRGSLKEPFALFLLSIETGEKRRLTSPPAQVLGDSGPASSPDGRRLAFTRAVDANLSDLYLLALSDGLKALGEPRQLTFGNRGATSPTWTADGREIIFANPISGLWRVAVPSSTERPAEPRELVSLGGEHPQTGDFPPWKPSRLRAIFSASQHLAYCGTRQPERRDSEEPVSYDRHTLHLLNQERFGPAVLTGRQENRFHVGALRATRNLGLR
jgi:dipeptidyl aminopeptidase/acylaminoacyl peptidase